MRIFAFFYSSYPLATIGAISCRLVRTIQTWFVLYAIIAKKELKCGDDNYSIRFEISNNSSTIRFDSIQNEKNTICTALVETAASRSLIWHTNRYTTTKPLVVLVVVTCFLLVRENWKKSGNLSGQRKIFFLEKSEQSGKMKNWCHQMSVFEAKMHQILFPLELRPRPRCGSLQCSPRLPSCT